MAIGGVVTWLVVPVFKIINYLLLEPELHRKRGRAIGVLAARRGGGGRLSIGHHPLPGPLRSHRHGRAATSAT